MPTTSDEIAIEKHNLLFGVRRSIRYHTARRKFFDRCHKITTAISLIFGSAAIFTVLSNSGEIYTIAAAAFVSIVAAIDLVVGNTDKARLHHDLAKRFIGLEKEMVSVREPTDDDLNLWTATRLGIESEEPPVKRVLDAMMHNELLRAMDYDKESGQYVRIGRFQRLFAQLFDLQQHILRKKESVRKSAKEGEAVVVKQDSGTQVEARSTDIELSAGAQESEREPVEPTKSSPSGRRPIQ